MASNFTAKLRTDGGKKQQPENIRTDVQKTSLTIEIHFQLNNCGNVSNSSREISHEVSFAFSVFEG